MGGCVFPCKFFFLVVLTNLSSDLHLMCVLDLRFALYMLAWAVLRAITCCATQGANQIPFLQGVSASRVRDSCEACPYF